MPTQNFKGKSFVYNHHLGVKYPQLVSKPKLCSTTLTLKSDESLGSHYGKKRLVFAPAKYVDTCTVEIEYCQLPFEIYRIKE
jgi:hypothetical protein